MTETEFVFTRFATIVTMLLVACGTVWRQEAESPAKTRLELVKSGLSEQRKAISSIEYRFQSIVNNSSREGYYVRDGEKEYSALAAPYEAAWDGKTSYLRLGGMQVRTSDKSDFRPGDTLPDAAVLTDIELALGYRSDPEWKFTFLEAKAVTIDGSEYVELEFAVDRTGDTVTTRYDPSRGYWPTYTKITSRNGFVRGEMNVTSFATIETNGTKVYFPLLISRNANVESGGGNRLRWEVDQRTLRINAAVNPERFVLKPWPNETVRDRTTGTTTPPADRNWSAVGKVDFPWSEIVERAEARSSEWRTAGEGSSDDEGWTVSGAPIGTAGR